MFETQEIENVSSRSWIKINPSLRYSAPIHPESLGWNLLKDILRVDRMVDDPGWNILLNSMCVYVFPAEFMLVNQIPRS